LCRYLALSVWPSALTLDYGSYLARTVGEVAPYAAVVLLLLALTFVGLWRNPPMGFCGLWFFLILAPTSSVVSITTQTGAEHRMYLPLGARTVARNEEYRSEVSIWQTVVDRWPINPRAHYTLGVALANAGRRPEA